MTATTLDRVTVSSAPYAYGRDKRSERRHRQCYIAQGFDRGSGRGWYVWGRRLTVDYGRAHRSYAAWWGPFETEDAARARADEYYRGPTE